jgi:hypothetical protein
MNIPKPKKYETEMEYVLKWCNNAAVCQAYPEKQKRINLVKAAFKQNFMPNQ